MKKLFKGIVTVCLALAMIVTMIAPVTAEAATTKSLTLYKGEAMYVSGLGTVKSVSSSKKSVVAASKDTTYSGRVNLTAKKTGTATITIKTSSSTVKYKITVKKLDITVKITDLGDGYLLLAAKNNTKQTFSAVELTYTLKNAEGETVVKDTANVYDVVAGKTVYKKVYYSQSSYTLDVSQCTATATADDRSLSTTYKNASTKVTPTVTMTDKGSGTLSLTVKSQNKLKSKSASGYHYIRIYDENGKLVDVLSVSFYLKAGAVDTVSRNVYFGSSVDVSNYTYKVTTVAYYRVY